MEQYVATTVSGLIQCSYVELQAITAGIITAQVTVHKGTFSRRRKGSYHLLVMVLFEIEDRTGRRLQPVAEAQVAQDIVVQQELVEQLLQQLAALSDEETVTSLSDRGRNAKPEKTIPPVLTCDHLAINQ